MSSSSHLACVKLKARWISWVDYKSLSPPGHGCPPNTAQTHPQSQYLVICHIFMRFVSITGVTNYITCQWFRKQWMCFLFMDCLIYILFPHQNLNVSLQLLLQSWRGRTAEQNLLQVNGFYFAKAGPNSCSGTVALTPPDSPTVCSSNCERAGFSVTVFYSAVWWCPVQWGNV